MPSNDDRAARTIFPPLILMYHAVVNRPLTVFDWCFIQGAAFEAQLEYLKARYDIVPLVRIPALLKEGASRPTVAITFDDGFLNNYEVAFPILRRVGVKATIFICTDFVDTDNMLWFCRLNRTLAETNQTSFEWGGMSFDLSTADKRAVASARLQAKLKESRQNDLTENLETIIAALVEGPHPPLEAHSPYRMLTRAAIREMVDSGLVEIGAHTKSHAILTRLSSTERKDEIEGSISAVERLVGRRCRLFAFPNGRRCDYDQECVNVLTTAGITAAVTSIAGVNQAGTPALELNRIGIGGDLLFHDFRTYLS